MSMCSSITLKGADETFTVGAKDLAGRWLNTSTPFRPNLKFVLITRNSFIELQTNLINGRNQAPQ